MANDQNALPDLIEVITRVQNGNEPENREVRVELRIDSVTLAADACLEFVVELNRANLSLDLDGFEVVPKSRHGEPTKPNDVSVEHKLTKESTKQAEAGATAELNLSSQPSAALNAKGSGNVASKTIESMSAQQTYSLLRVKARGNLRWEVSEPGDGDKPLGDTYLNDDVLCKIKALPGANMLAVKLAAFARKRDIRVTPVSKVSKLAFKSKNHEKMLNALVGKALSHSESNGGIITFSVSEIVVEDDGLHR
ncbi:hypothetical protein ACNJYA_09280 [Bradyrhizobium sp. DASA03068]|uniref:hypothetical protein n=1 Tax=Bradyrhizobium sp. BLXBL-01 TaxID=3395915 RepID=UPI003F703192